MIDLDRRAALRTLGTVLVAAAGWPRRAGALGHDDALTAWLVERFGALDWSELSAGVRAGRAGRSSEALVGDLLAGRRSNEPLDRFLARRVREDFEAERIVDLAGWRIARTESHLLMLLDARSGS